MKKITIIGKNSKLFNIVREEIEKYCIIVDSISHKDVKNCKSIVNPVLFSFSSLSVEENINLINLVKKASIGKIIYISSTAVNAYGICEFYGYPRIKKKIEDYLLPFSNSRIIRIGICEGLSNLSSFRGKIKFSSLAVIAESINKALNEDSKKLIESWNFIDVKSNKLHFRIFSYLQGFLFRYLKKYFFITRPLDILYKLLGYNNYGYTFLSNQVDVKYWNNIVVGCGMASLGVLQAIEEKELLKETMLVHSFSSNKIYSDVRRQGKSIEYEGKGGNSNFWHSVVSVFNNNNVINTIRLKFLNSWFNHTSWELLLDGYAFIPNRPIRPLTKIRRALNSDSIIDEKVLLIERIGKADYGICIYTDKSFYYCRKVFLCAGTISSLNLLYRSSLIDARELLLSEHLVGYFGQFSVNKNRVVDKSKFVGFGHFKVFHEIAISKERSLFCTFRPAYYDFKNLNKVEEYRDFFGRKSSSVIHSLLLKMKASLVLEALYNKFGFSVFSTNTYNVAGHVQSNLSVSMTFCREKDPMIKYNEEVISYTENEKNRFKDYIKRFYIDSNIVIPDTVKCSPGLHFLKACNSRGDRLDLSSLELDGIYCFGTYLFDDKSPRHPTFDLYVSSFVKTKKILI